MKKYRDVDMKKYTSFKAGGKASELIVLETTEEVLNTLKELNQSGKKYMILGNGSNTLFSDKGYDGIVIKLGDEFSKIKVEGEKVICGSGALLSSAARIALGESLTGMEFASGIPGSLGGAIFMNAGAYGGEMKDIVEEVTLVKRDGSKVIKLKTDDLDLSYRHSVLEETGDIVTEIVLKLAKGNKEEISEKMSELAKKRNDKQPVNFPSAGSFFKRPEGHFAGKLIQDAGLKGASVGGAQVSELHCGFIINKGNATASDIINLMHLVQEKVLKDFGVKLEPEVRIIGE